MNMWVPLLMAPLVLLGCDKSSTDDSTPTKPTGPINNENVTKNEAVTKAVEAGLSTDTTSNEQALEAVEASNQTDTVENSTASAQMQDTNNGSGKVKRSKEELLADAKAMVDEMGRNPAKFDFANLKSAKSNLIPVAPDIDDVIDKEEADNGISAILVGVSKSGKTHIFNSLCNKNYKTEKRGGNPLTNSFVRATVSNQYTDKYISLTDTPAVESDSDSYTIGDSLLYRTARVSQSLANKSFNAIILVIDRWDNPKDVSNVFYAALAEMNLKAEDEEVRKRIIILINNKRNDNVITLTEIQGPQYLRAKYPVIYYEKGGDKIKLASNIYNEIYNLPKEKVFKWA